MKLYKIAAPLLLIAVIGILPSCSDEIDGVAPSNGGMTEQSEEKAEESTTNEGGLHHDFGNEAIPFDASRVQTEIASAQNDFALRMLTKKGDKNTNFVFSPFTVNHVLGMAAFMALNDDYAAKIAEALGLDASYLTEMHNFNRRFADYIASADSYAKIRTDNSIISECGIPEIEGLIRYYNPEMMLSVADLQAMLNGWVSDKSGGQINELKIDLEKIEGLPRTYLSSLINFNMIWRGEINRSNTKNEEFTNADGSRSEVRMMHIGQECSVYNGPDCMVLRMPFSNKAFEMLVVLPDEDKTLEHILAALTNASLNETLSSVHAYNMDTFGSVCLPRFETQVETNISDIFDGAGLDKFPIRTVYNGMEVPTFLRNAVNETLFRISEHGVYGVSVTTWAGGCGAYNGPEQKLEPPKFIANRPFAFFVREASTGSFLMAGAIRNLK